MDRICFSKSIDVDPVLQIKYFFNEVMAMYNLIEGVNYKYIHGLVQENEINFVISFDTAKEVSIVHDSLIGKLVQIYNSNFKIHGYINNCDLSVKLVKL